MSQVQDVGYSYNPLGQVVQTIYPAGGEGTRVQMGTNVLAGQTYTVSSAT